MQNRPTHVPDDETRVGSGGWVRKALQDMDAEPDRFASPACDRLITWLYYVAVRRARAAGVPARDITEVAQDAMPRIVGSLRPVDDSTAAINPAAMFERIVERAVSGATYRLRMEGFGGVQPNGRDWHALFPRIVNGEAASRALEMLPATVIEQPVCHSQDIGQQFAEWVSTQLEVTLTDDARHAFLYVLDRLAAGVSRPSLVRGGNAGLTVDPAMRFLGFDAKTAGSFARWLLGRTDSGHAFPAALDAFRTEGVHRPEALAQWRRLALSAGFARALTEAVDETSPQPESSRRIA